MEYVHEYCTVTRVRGTSQATEHTTVDYGGKAVLRSTSIVRLYSSWYCRNPYTVGILGVCCCRTRVGSRSTATYSVPVPWYAAAEVCGYWKKLAITDYNSDKQSDDAPGSTPLPRCSRRTCARPPAHGKGAALTGARRPSRFDLQVQTCSKSRPDRCRAPTSWPTTLVMRPTALSRYASSRARCVW